MRWLYNISIGGYSGLIRLASPLHRKAHKWAHGRRGIFSAMEKAGIGKEPVIWIHCASLGEFEQGRPIIEAIKARSPQQKILLTFFSPSGYEVKKSYDKADFIFYLPEDTQLKSGKFLDLVKPKLAIFVKYEFWPNYMLEMRKRKIPLISISTILRPEQRFFKWYGGWFRQTLLAVDHFFIQTKKTGELLKKIGLENFTLSGDTRFDRVYDIARNIRPIPIVDVFAENSRVVIAGSSWPQEESALSRFMATETGNVKLIIAPHEVNEGHLRDIESQFPDVIRYSSATLDQVGMSRVMLIDNVGMLSQLYQYGDIAVVGGGFGRGLHNILEAATFGMPVLFGSEYSKFQEAHDLIELGGAKSVDSPEALVHALKKLTQSQEATSKAAEISRNYVKEQTGATEKIMNYLLEKNYLSAG